MVRTLVTGATGRLGTALLPRLKTAGHAVRAASRTPPEKSEESLEWVELDLIGGRGIESALENVDVIIHAATAPQGNTEAVDVQGTKRLLEAAQEADITNFVYPSIVGIDEIPFSYYKHKVAAETAVEGSNLATTIVRATQFHSFVAKMLSYVAKLPVWPLPTKIQLQPVDVGEVADAIVKYATLGAAGRTDPIGGPEIRSVGELAREYRTARGLRRPIIRFPIPGKTASEFRAGHAVCPDHIVGTVTWEKWLTDRSEGYEDTLRVQSQSIR